MELELEAESAVATAASTAASAASALASTALAASTLASALLSSADQLGHQSQHLHKDATDSAALLSLSAEALWAAK